MSLRSVVGPYTYKCEIKNIIITEVVTFICL